jgi:predicted nucleic acid-binding protein
VSIFVGSSVWFAAMDSEIGITPRAKDLEKQLEPCHDHHVLIETWLLLNSRYRPEVANRFWEQLQQSGVRKEIAEF